MLQTFIAHAGQVTHIVQRHFQEDMVFCQTVDGQFCETCVIQVVKYIEQ